MPTYQAIGLISVRAAPRAPPTPRTQVVVVVDAESGVQTDALTLQIAVQGGVDGAPLAERFSVEVGGAASPIEWPVNIAIVPLNNDSDRVFAVEVIALSASGDTAGTVRARSGFLAERTLRLDLRMESCCRTVAATCDPQETCRSCACEAVEPVDPTTLPEYQKDPPPSFDASTDALPPSDAATDAPPPSDAATDALPPSDAATDARRPSDAATDALPPSDAGRCDGGPCPPDPCACDPQTVASGQNGALGIVLDSTHVYWTNADGDEVMRSLKDGTSRETLAMGQAGASGIALDSDRVYWTNHASTQVMRAYKNGTDLATIAGGQNRPLGIAVAGLFVYWTNHGVHEVRRARKNGVFPETLAMGQNGASGIALDITGLSGLYWTNTDGDEVMRLPLCCVP